MSDQKSFFKVGDIIRKFDTDSDKDKRSLSLEFSRDKYISREFQKYGYDLAEELGDLKNKSLYIKLAKDTPRGLLEAARNFVKDAFQVKSRPKLFMWKLSQLKAAKAGTQEESRKAGSTYLAKRGQAPLMSNPGPQSGKNI